MNEVPPLFRTIEVNTFDRLRAIIDGTHLHAMTELESKVLLVFVSRSDYLTGDAYPSIESIADDVGCKNLNRTRKAVQRLEDKGILVRRVDSHGRNVVLRRLSVPNRDGERPGSTGTVNVPDAEQNGGGQPGRSATLNRDGGRPCNRAAQRPSTGPRTVPRTTKNNSKNNKENNNSRALRPKPSCDNAPIPAVLDTSEFRQAWGEWIEYRQQMKKPLGPMSAEKQLKKLAGWGPQRAVDAIETSIANTWQGIFEPRTNHGSNNGRFKETRKEEEARRGFHKDQTPALPVTKLGGDEVGRAADLAAAQAG
ncbi:MAG TPA: helix-turn-helix domain-containing protein [Tepidisphaeraceae bacterium]|nr:helix-turn-helix domain-containing protein [Tepidisphaeraceae bacterium]